MMQSVRKRAPHATFSPINDAFIDEEEYWLEHDWTLMKIRSQKGANRRILIEFDISSISPNSIISAILFLRAYDQINYPRLQVVNRIIGVWTEETVTWDNQPAVTTENQISVSISAEVPAWKSYDVTLMTGDARQVGNTVGYRIMDSEENLPSGSAALISFFSKEYLPRIPILEIYYKPD